MVRVITQILIGLMLLFGALNLSRRSIFYFRSKSLPRALYFLLLLAVCIFFSVLAFYYAYSGINDMLGRA